MSINVFLTIIIVLLVVLVLSVSSLLALIYGALVRLRLDFQEAIEMFTRQEETLDDFTLPMKFSILPEKELLQ